MKRETLDAIRAWLDGEAVEVSYREGTKWFDMPATTGEHFSVAFSDGNRYRIKPRTIRIGGYDVPEPVRDPPEEGTMFYIPDVMFIKQPYAHVWVDTAYNRKVLLLGLIHLTSEAAELHAKALVSLTEMKP